MKAIATQALIFLILIATFITLSIPSIIKEIEINRTTTTILATTIIKAQECENDRDCQEGYWCYPPKNCMIGIQGISKCTPGGTCIKECNSDSDCGFGKVCEELRYFVGDVGTSRKGCVTETECNTEQDCIDSGKCDPGLECTCYEGKCYQGLVAGVTTIISGQKWAEYEHPQLHYTVSYPKNWIGPTERGGDPSSGFSLVQISHPEKPINKDNWLMGDGYDHKVVIGIATSKTSYISVDEYYNNQASKFLGTITNKEKVVVDAQEAIQYTSRFESEYVATILIKNGVLYRVRYDYANLEEKERNWNVYIEMLNSFRMP